VPSLPYGGEGQDLVEIVGVCLLKLIARSMRFGPSPDDLEFVAEVFTEDLVRANKTKHLKIVEAFDYIGTNDRDWPQPARVIEVINLLARQARGLEDSRLLPAPPPDKEKGIVNVAKLKEMVASCVDDGQPKPEARRKAFDMGRHMESEFGTFPLTDEELIEAQRIFKEGGMGAHNEFLKSLHVEKFPGVQYNVPQEIPSE